MGFRKSVAQFYRLAVKPFRRSLSEFITCFFALGLGLLEKNLSLILCSNETNVDSSTSSRWQSDTALFETNRTNTQD
jgi:hypothetical protein